MGFWANRHERWHKIAEFFKKHKKVIGQLILPTVEKAVEKRLPDNLDPAIKVAETIVENELKKPGD